MLGKKDAYLREARTRYERPIVFPRWTYPNENFDRHAYQKGAAVLNMLRWVLGDGAFRGAMTHFLEENAFQPVDTHDLIDAIKEATGQNIDWFFEQWIYSAGHPRFDVSYQWSESTGTIALRVRQKGELFRMPVQIGVHTRSERRSEKFWLESKDETFEIASTEKPLLVRFDEGNYLIKEWTFDKSAEELLYQLENDDVIGRMWAAAELTDHRALEKAARSDPFWSVRVAALEALGKTASVEFLKPRALDGNSKVRVVALRLLGELERVELAPFFIECFEGDDSYLVQAEAVRAFGKVADASARSFLERPAALDSPRDVIASAARAALETRTQE